jgi:hypothetical protein
MIPMRISASFAGFPRWLRVRARNVRVAVPFGELMDVAGDDPALRAPHLPLVGRIIDRPAPGFTHGIPHLNLV